MHIRLTNKGRALHLETRPQLEIPSAQPGRVSPSLRSFTSSPLQRSPAINKAGASPASPPHCSPSTFQQRKQASQTEGRADGWSRDSDIACAQGVEFSTLLAGIGARQIRHGRNAAQQRGASQAGELEQAEYSLRINLLHRYASADVLDIAPIAGREQQAPGIRLTPQGGITITRAVNTPQDKSRTR